MYKDPDYCIQGVLDSNRLIFARTITLIESTLPTHQEIAKHVVNALLPQRGLAEIWETITDHKQRMTASGELEKKRQEQTMSWKYFLVNDVLERWFYRHPAIQQKLPDLLHNVETGKIAPTRAADELVAAMLGKDLLLGIAG